MSASGATILENRPKHEPALRGKSRPLLNDSDFVDGLRRRDPAAVRHLTECYLPSIWRFVYVQVGGDDHVAEDIVGEAVLALIRAAAAGAEIQHPAAWLRSVAGNKTQDHFRAAARVRHLIDQVKRTEPTTNENDASRQEELSERRTQIRQVMDELPERERLALEWKYIEKLSVREIATRLEQTEKAVESILFRARREFREKLSRKEKKDSRAAPIAASPWSGKPDHRPEPEETEDMGAVTAKSTEWAAIHRSHSERS